MKIIAIYIIWNVITFLLMGIDKLKAEKGQWRISESTLLICAFLMGGVGSFLGGQTVRHKTKKLKFKILLPLSAAVNICVIVVYTLYVVRYCTT